MTYETTLDAVRDLSEHDGPVYRAVPVQREWHPLDGLNSVERWHLIKEGSIKLPLANTKKYYREGQAAKRKANRKAGLTADGKPRQRRLYKWRGMSKDKAAYMREYRRAQ